MLRLLIILFYLQGICTNAFAQQYSDSSHHKLTTQFTASIEFSDAAINSIAALNSLIKKENYRNKISSFNNPTSSDMGFNLQIEINSALKPLLDKAKNVNQNKFMDVVGSLVGNQSKTGGTKSYIPTTSIFSTISSLVGNLAIREKKITKTDLDSFMLNIAKYFGQYEKLNRINQQFDISIEKVDLRLQELQGDLKDYLLDLIISSNPSLQRSSLKQKSVEELLLKHLDKHQIENQIQKRNNEIYNTQTTKNIYFPSDAIKTAKDITATIQKIFNEYQKIYTANYNDIKAILQETKQLGRGVNKQVIDISLAELQTLYTESKSADVLNLRLLTLTERLKTLVTTEKIK
jgi:hypothetical protein